jgi:hypothetical protein
MCAKELSNGDLIFLLLRHVEHVDVGGVGFVGLQLSSQRTDPCLALVFLVLLVIERERDVQ